MCYVSFPSIFTFFYLNRYDRVGQMSGGERRRLQLLQVLARAPNVLLLDEPSKSFFIEAFIILSSPFLSSLYSSLYNFPLFFLTLSFSLSLSLSLSLSFSLSLSLALTHS